MDNPHGGAPTSVCVFRLRQLAIQLKADGYKSVQIADVFGVKESYVSRLLRSDIYDKKEVTGSTLLRVTRRLKISGDYFLGDYPASEVRNYRDYVIDLNKVREQRQFSAVTRENEEIRKENAVLKRTMDAVLERLEALESAKNRNAKSADVPDGQPSRVGRK